MGSCGRSECSDVHRHMSSAYFLPALGVLLSFLGAAFFSAALGLVPTAWAGLTFLGAPIVGPLSTFSLAVLAGCAGPAGRGSPSSATAPAATASLATSAPPGSA